MNGRSTFCLPRRSRPQHLAGPLNRQPPVEDILQCGRVGAV